MMFPLYFTFHRNNSLFLVRLWKLRTAGVSPSEKSELLRGRTDGRTDGGRDGQHVWFIASITLFISSPLIKRNAVYQSYYIHTNGHTIAVNHSVVNKSLNQDVLFFFCPFCCGALLLWKEVQAGRTPQLRKQNQTKQHLHKDHLDFIQQMFSLSLFFFLMYLKATKLARAKSACN